MRKYSSVPWTREHSLVALNLYFKLPFGKLHKGNPIIIDVATRLGRTSSSLAMKLCNFASLDPVLKLRGIKGLEGASRGDREIWTEFQSNLSVLTPESEQLLHDLFTKENDRELDFLQRDKVRLEPFDNIHPLGPTELTATVKVRRGQQFFRQAILNAYGVACCISGINVPQLLVASHIKPWSKCSDSDRLDLRNGLCLSNIHDSAFDSFLITLDTKFRVTLSKRLKNYLPQSMIEQNFVAFEGQPIRLPNQAAEPAAEFLSFHRDVFASHAN